MASIPNGLSYLTQPGGLLSSLPAAVPAAVLLKASAQDLVTLSAAALQAQEVDGLFGIAQPSSLAPVATAADASNQATLMQQVQRLFNLPTSPPSTTTAFG
jgi:hypothetical protein